MHVEVNERNIKMYELVALTGNSVEELLAAAARAAEEGYTLMCEVPELDEDLIHMNVFDTVEGEVVDPKLSHDGASPYGENGDGQA